MAWDFSSFFNGSDFNTMAQSLAGMYGAGQSMNVNNQVNQQIQPQLAQNQAATQAQIDSLTGQINQNRQQAQDMYQRSLADTQLQNTGLEGNIGTMTANLNALSDPNSPYMQQARAGIERKDAAAGRRSQWGEREVQLAGTLADYVGKYSPGINQSITGARDQINRNNQGLASLYATANAPADRNTLAQIQALQQQIANATAQNTVGRQAQNSNVNAGQNMIQQGIKGIGGLASLFGRGGSSGSSLYDTNNGAGFLGGGWGYGSEGLGNGMGFTGGGVDTDYLGLAGNSSLDQGMSNYHPYGFTSSIGGWGAPAADSFSGLEGALDFNDPNSGLWD